MPKINHYCAGCGGEHPLPLCPLLEYETPDDPQTAALFEEDADGYRPGDIDPNEPATREASIPDTGGNGAYYCPACGTHHQGQYICPHLELGPITRGDSL